MTKPTLCFFLTLSLWAAIGRGESGASLAGIVKDPQGLPVSGTTLTLSSHSGAMGATTSDTSGAYRFEGLPEGDYILAAESRGFAPFLAEHIHLGPGAAEKRDVALSLAGLHDQIAVTASGTPQTPEQLSKAVTVIDQSDADSRDASALSDIVNLAPGVRVQQLGGTGAFATIQWPARSGHSRARRWHSSARRFRNAGGCFGAD
jgi:hypothetical protein